MITLRSPAKLNLFLRILSKRADGYHELASLFQAITLFDTLAFSKADQDALTSEGIPVPLNRSNLIWKAVDLFRKKTGRIFALQVHVEKRIPLEAGLGGGSSNAATTLWGLNNLAGSPASPEELRSWASELGSDVAFFLSQGTAYCTGKGEEVAEVDVLPFSPEITVIKPHQGLSTPQVYAALKVDDLEAKDPKAALDSFLKGIPHYYNDLEEPAFTIDPSLKELKEKLLKHGFEAVVLAGSGSSFFCVGEAPKIPCDRFFSARAHFAHRSPDGWY